MTRRDRPPTFQLAERFSTRLAAGFRGIDAALDVDGALPAAEKALFTAAAAAAQYLRDLCDHRLARARDLGLPATAAAGAAQLLLLNRGETAFRDFVSAIDAVYGDAAAVEASDAAP